MANIVVLGGGFAGVVAAESLVKLLGPEHQITLISRRREFTFFPALVRLAFGHCTLEDVSFNLTAALHERRIEFVEAEIARPVPDDRCVVLTNGEHESQRPYDYLVFALGRQLAAENVPGLLAHAHHLLTVNAALRFGAAVRDFHGGHAVIGYCPDARLAVPVYETAFALDRLLRARGERDRTKISIVCPEHLGDLSGGAIVAPRLQAALNEHDIELISEFPVDLVTAKELRSSNGQRLEHDLLMLVPPFEGPREAMYTGLIDPNNYVRVDRHMRATGAERIYAAGDAVNLLGPKMGHMAVLQGEIAAANIAAEIKGRAPEARYDHEVMQVIDEGGRDSLYVHRKLWERTGTDARQGRFWGWAKQAHARYWPRLHGLNHVESAEE